MQEIDKIANQQEEIEKITHLVQKFEECSRNERMFKGFKLYVCLETYLMFKSQNITKAKYLTPFVNTPVRRSLEYILTLGMKLDLISSWLDEEVEVWRLQEVLNINFSSKTVVQFQKVSKK